MKMSKKKVSLLAVVFVCLAVVSLLLTIGDSDDIVSDISNDELSQELEEAREAERRTQEQVDNLSVLYEEETTNTSKMSESIKSASQLSELGDEDIGEVGITIVKTLIAENSVSEANKYIDVIITGGDKYSLESAVYCIQIANSSERREYCVNRLNEIARIQGIIKESEELPEYYYSNSNGEAG